MPDEKSVDGGKKIFTVSSLTSDIKAVIESGFAGLWVEGEISNFKVYPSGHAYFDLKDDKALLNAVMWKGSRKYLKFEPKQGDHVVCRGRLSVYEKYGKYQLVAESMEPKGLGALQAEFEALKKKLKAEGLFDQERKNPLPYIPWSVGIVTSPAGAVIKDIIRTLNRRFPGLHIILNPVRVQGDGAAKEIARAIFEFNEYGKVDVMIVGRGGGSLEDLWAFNEEEVARAIASSAIPVVSAVGHETDFTIADFVADLRASTPTAAAEMVAPEREAIENAIDEFVERMTGQLRDTVESNRQDIDGLTGRAARAISHDLALVSGRLNAVYLHLGAVSPSKKLELRREKLLELQRAMARGVSRLFEALNIKIVNLTGRLTALKPERWIDTRRQIVEQYAKDM
ncbi:Exodeoxyribonuclease VII large subunit, partial [hydrothermal vent metagenome]